MFRRVNKDEAIRNNWPCIFCDEWSHDFIHQHLSLLKDKMLFEQAKQKLWIVFLPHQVIDYRYFKTEGSERNVQTCK